MRISELIAKLQAVRALHGDALVLVDRGDEDAYNLQDDARLCVFKGWDHGEYRGWREYPDPSEDLPGHGTFCVHLD